MKNALTFSLLLLALFAFGQTNLAETETELARLGNRSIAAKTEEQRLAAADSFLVLLEKTINTKTAFDYPFEKVTNLSKLQAPDKAFRIYSWAVPMRNGSFTFYGRLVLNTANAQKTIVLKDDADSIVNPEYQLLKADKWFGAIYYDIILTKNKGKNYYSLLGYRPNQSTYHQKIIDVLAEDNLDKIRFGERIFNTPLINGITYKKRPYRLIFRYNPKTVASVKYVDHKIVMDHLAVPDISQKEEWALYGPDFTYHALVWEKGQWELMDNLELKGDVKPAGPAPTQKGLPKK